MKRFNDYPVSIRAKALELACERHGLVCWDRTFDQNAPQIVDICEEVMRPMRDKLFAALRKKKTDEAWGGKYDPEYPSELMLSLHQERYWRLLGYPRMSDIGGYSVTLADVKDIEKILQKQFGDEYWQRDKVEAMNEAILVQLRSIEQERRPEHPRLRAPLVDIIVIAS